MTTAGRCDLQNVDWSSGIVTADDMVFNLQNATKSALYSLTGDTRIVPKGMVVEQSLVIQVTHICGQSLDGIQ